MCTYALDQPSDSGSRGVSLELNRDRFQCAHGPTSASSELQLPKDSVSLAQQNMSLWYESFKNYKCPWSSCNGETLFYTGKHQNLKQLDCCLCEGNTHTKEGLQQGWWTFGPPFISWWAESSIAPGFKISFLPSFLNTCTDTFTNSCLINPSPRMLSWIKKGLTLLKGDKWAQTSLDLWNTITKDISMNPHHQHTSIYNKDNCYATFNYQAFLKRSLGTVVCRGAESVCEETSTLWAAHYWAWFWESWVQVSSVKCFTCTVCQIRYGNLLQHIAERANAVEIAKNF